MSLTLTQLASDNFQRANVNPLVSPWAAPSITQGLAIVSEVCEGPGEYGGWQFYDYDLPNDQYASATIATLPEDENGFMLLVRATDNGGNVVTIPGYLLEVFQFPGNCEWELRIPGSEILSGSVAAINPGDVFTLAAVGTTIYVFQNSTLLGSITDTTYSSGGTALECDASEVHLSNFAIGSAAVSTGPTPTPDVPTDPYLGCVTLTNGGDSPAPGQSGVVYVGCVRIVAAPRSGSIPNPYLGNFTLVSSPPAGFANPGAFLGEVTVVASPPNGAPAIPLGQVKQVS
jgi:hypothetical protein